MPALLQILADRDPETAGHSRRVALYCMALAAVLGLDAAGRRALYRAARLHDIGKLFVPPGILDRPGRLTEDEWDQVRAHPWHGARLAVAAGVAPEVFDAIRCHHERWDGTGYPEGLGGRDIPWLARILAVADAYDAMTAGRPYRAACSVAEARAELGRVRGTQLDPVVVNAFLDLPAWLLERIGRRPAGARRPVAGHGVTIYQ